MEEEDLENKVEKLNAKQWLPLAGPFIAVKDAVQGKPYIMDPEHPLRFGYSIVHHGLMKHTARTDTI